MDRRRFNAVAAFAGLATAAYGSPAAAQQLPRDTMRIVVPWTPGGVTDLLARVVAERLGPLESKTVLVENRTGAAGMLGTDFVAKSPPDGNTLAVAIAGSMGLNVLLYKKVPYDPDRDLALITVAVSQPSILVVSTRFPAQDLAQLIDLIRAHPGKYSYASSGAGSLSHLGMEAFAATLGTRLTHVPYASSTPGIMAILSGDVDMAMHPANVCMTQVKAGKLRALAISTAQRSPLIPDLPTLGEGGVADVECDSWMGFSTAAQTPVSTIDRLQREIAAVLNEPQVNASLKAQYMDVVASTPAEARRMLAADIARWKPIIERRRIALD